MSTYTGTLIRDSIAKTESVMAANWSATEAVLAGILDPGMYLADVKKYLSVGAAIDSGDEAAWWAVHDVQECHFTGLITECYFCGKLEGQHAEWTGWCPDNDPSPTFPRPRNVFRMVGLDYGPEMEQYRRKG